MSPREPEWGHEKAPQRAKVLTRMARTSCLYSLGLGSVINVLASSTRGLFSQRRLQKSRICLTVQYFTCWRCACYCTVLLRWGFLFASCYTVPRKKLESCEGSLVRTLLLRVRIVSWSQKTKLETVIFQNYR